MLHQRLPIIRINRLILILITAYLSVNQCFSFDLDSLKQEYRTEADQDKKLLLVYQISKKYIKIQPDSALFYGEKYLEHAREFGSKKDIGNAFSNLGLVYFYREDYKTANQKYDKSNQIFESIDYKRGIGINKNSAAIYYARIGKHSKALKLAFEALELLKEYGEEKDVSTPLTTIGIIYMRERNFDESEKYFLKALASSKVDPLEKGNANILNNLGLIHFKRQNFNKAIEYFQKTLKLDSINGNLRGMSSTYSNLAISFKNLERYEEAMTYNKLSLKMDGELNSPRGIAASMNNIGSLLLKLNRVEEAIDTFEKGLLIARKLNDKVIIKDFLANLADSYEELNDYRQAIVYFKEFNEIEDSLFSIQSKTQIADLQAKHEMASTMALKDSELRRKEQMNWFLILFLVLIVMFGVVGYFRFRTRKKLELQLQGMKYEKQLFQLQMNPHFIFNALGSISSYITLQERTKAVHYLNKFAKLIRAQLENGRNGVVSIENEINNLKNYLDLEQMRSEQKFEYEIIVDENISKQWYIPPTLIQPFVENSVLHAFHSSIKTPKVTIHFRTNKEKLIAVVQDNGIGINSESVPAHNRIKHKSLSTSIVNDYFSNMNKLQNNQLEVFYSDVKQGTRVNIELAYLNN